MSRGRNSTTKPPSLDLLADDALPLIGRTLVVNRGSVIEFRTNEWRRLLADDALPNVRGALVIGRQSVGVNARCHIRVSVAEPCRNGRKRHAAGEQDRRVSVT